MIFDRSYNCHASAEDLSALTTAMRARKICPRSQLPWERRRFDRAHKCHVSAGDLTTLTTAMGAREI